MYWHPFVNVSLTSSECSIVCPRDHADLHFSQMLRSVSADIQNEVLISQEDYSAILISGEGLDAAQRVLDLTGPLAIAGIPIFFITSYSSDYIIVPYASRGRVIHALQNRGFVFEAQRNGEAIEMTDSMSAKVQGQNESSDGGHDLPLPQDDGDMIELRKRTIETLQSYSIAPQADSSMHLVTCSGVKDSNATASAMNYSEGKVQLGVTKCLTATPPPNFFSLTLTDTEPASLTLERRLISYFHNEGEDLLLGKDGPEQIAITLDLKQLPLTSTGIVCGVASCLKEGMEGRGGRMFNMSYLSTAKAGHVIVYREELVDAMKALESMEHAV